MISVSDFLKILDSIPIWKTLKVLPERIAALEARIAQLEAKNVLPDKVPAAPCKYCGNRSMRMINSVADSQFGDLGANRETWQCAECGQQEKKLTT